MTTIRKAAPLTPERRRLPDRRVPSFDSDNFTKSERVTDEHQAVPISAAELSQLREKSAIYDWIIANCTYLEHRVNDILPQNVDVGGYFPQSASDYAATVPELHGLDLDDYLNAVSK